MRTAEGGAAIAVGLVRQPRQVHHLRSAAVDSGLCFWPVPLKNVRRPQCRCRGNPGVDVDRPHALTQMFMQYLTPAVTAADSCSSRSSGPPPAAAAWWFVHARPRPRSRLDGDD